MSAKISTYNILKDPERPIIFIRSLGYLERMTPEEAVAFGTELINKAYPLTKAVKDRAKKQYYFWGER